MTSPVVYHIVSRRQSLKGHPLTPRIHAAACISGRVWTSLASLNCRQYHRLDGRYCLNLGSLGRAII